jgi:NTE family protein
MILGNGTLYLHTPGARPEGVPPVSLDTLIVQNLLNADRPEPSRGACALVLLGGGARTAYQAGVLKALAAMLAAHSPEAETLAPAFPFKWLFGTSAGALNASYLASRA